MPDSSLPMPRLAGAALERQLALQRPRRPADPLLSLVVPVFDEEEFDRPLPRHGRADPGARPAALRDRVRERRLARRHARPPARPQRRATGASGSSTCRATSARRPPSPPASTMPGAMSSIPMDIDLQDPPDLIGPFMERWREGYDIVYGVRIGPRPGTPRPSACRPAGSTGCSTRMSPVRIPAQCRRLPPGRPARGRGAAPASRAQPLHEGPVRLGRLQRDRRALRAAAARRRRDQVQSLAAVELRARRRGELLDRAAARLVLCRAW